MIFFMMERIGDLDDVEKIFNMLKKSELKGRDVYDDGIQSRSYLHMIKEKRRCSPRYMMALTTCRTVLPEERKDE